MKDLVAHCDKTIVKTEDNIKDLKNIREKEEYQKLEKTITMKHTPNLSYNKESSKSSVI